MIKRISILLSWALLFQACTHSSVAFQDNKLEDQRTVLQGRTVPLQVKRVIFFGDSFTDNSGRLLQHTHGLLPTQAYYWQGRFSNGPVWSDYLSAALNLPSISYAMAGARIKDKNSFGVPGDSLKVLEVPSADAQIELFVKEQGRFQSGDLALVWLGSNDYLFYADAGRVSTYVDQVMDVTTRMVSLGAQNILVFGLIPFDDVPLDPKGANGQNFDRKSLESLIEQHNRILETKVQALARQHPDINLHMVALGPYIRHIRQHAPDYGLTDLREPCFTGGVLLGSNSAVARLFQKDKKQLLCDHPRQHLFWDKAHPTTAVHCLAALHVLDRMQSFGFVSRFNARASERNCIDIQDPAS